MFLPFKNQNYLTLDNLSKYEHITLKFVGRYLYWVAKIFSKKKGYLVQKLGEEEKLSKSVSSYLKTKKEEEKNPMAIKPDEGFKPLHSSDRASIWNSWSDWSSGAL